jgi:hypothetical protein
LRVNTIEVHYMSVWKCHNNKCRVEEQKNREEEEEELVVAIEKIKINQELAQVSLFSWNTNAPTFLERHV